METKIFNDVGDDEVQSTSRNSEKVLALLKGYYHRLRAVATSVSKLPEVAYRHYLETS